MRRALAGVAVAILVSVTIGFLLRDDGPVETGPPAEVAAVRAAVPELLSAMCRIGDIPLTDSMGGIERGFLIDDALASLEAEVRAVYASSVVDDMMQLVTRVLEDDRYLPVTGRQGCRFEAEAFPRVEVDGDDASVEVAGSFVTERLTAPRPEGGFERREAALTVELRKEGGRWLLVSERSTEPIDSS